MYPSNFATERTEQHPKRNKTHIKVPDVEQKSPRQFFLFFLPWPNSPQWAKAFSMSRIHEHTQLDTSQSEEPLQTSDQPDAETPT